jgi:hypothetical protein
VNAREKQEKLKQLNDRKEKLYERQRSLKHQRRQSDKHFDFQINETHKEITRIKNEIRGLHTSPDTLIKDHAIVRYCERVMGMDMDLIRKEILSHGNAERLQGITDGKLPIKNGQAVVKNGCIVTVIGLDKDEIQPLSSTDV